MTFDTERELARALLLERRGQLEAAAQTYQNAGALEDAARLLDALDRHDEAGALLWNSLHTDLASLERLPPDKKKIALKAAVSYGQGSQTRLALLVMLALGERRLASELQHRMESGAGATSGPTAVVDAQAPRERRMSGSHPSVSSREVSSEISAETTSRDIASPVPPSDAAAVPARESPGAVPSHRRQTPSVPVIEERNSGPHRRMSGSFATVGNLVGGTATTGSGPITSAGGTNPIDDARAMERSGRLEEALAAYLGLGKTGWAARVARGLGRLDEAGELYLRGDMFLEAAACFLDSGAHTQCMQALLRVDRNNPGYRDACVHLIRLAAQLNVLDSQLEPFIADFVVTGPLRPQEQESFYLLARLREAHQFIDAAKDAYRRLLAANPDYADAAQQLARLEDGKSGRITGRTDSRPPAMTVARADSRPPTWPPLRRDSSPNINVTGVPSAPLQPGMGGPIVVPGDPAHRRSTGTIMIAGAPLGNGGPPPGSDVRRPTPFPAGNMAQFAAVASGVGPNPLFATGPSGVGPNPLFAGTPSGVGANPLFMPAGALTIGSVVAERYRLESKLGQGGMATVFKAFDSEIGEAIAIKLFTQPIEDEGMLQRFRQELSLSRHLNHPNIIRLFDIGSHFGMRFITMELLHGHELRDDLRNGPLPFRRSIDLLLQACAGLGVAHKLGIIHRDLKPENFFITDEGVLKIMDFGIAKRQSAPGVTVSGTMAGTPTYMSPEQISNFAAVSHATDLYAMGVVAYELFTGTVPFPGPEIMPILHGHLQKAPDPLRTRNPAVPEEVERVVLRLLNKKPDERYIDCDELAADLQDVRDSLPAPQA